MECRYCGGSVVFDAERGVHVHADGGERIKNIAPGDYASGAHNIAGTRVNPVDVVDDAAPAVQAGNSGPN